MNNKDTADKRPICRDKQKCKKYLQGNCQFSHPICRFGANCNRDSCRFTHDLNKTKQTKPTNAPCRYGKNCKNLLKGTCPFTHNSQSPPKKMDKNKECKFGANCKFFKEGKCMYVHPGQTKPIVQKNPQKNVVSPSQDDFERVQCWREDETCSNYIVNCQDEEMYCQKRHCFVSDNSLKRVYYDGKYNFVPNSEFKVAKISNKAVYIFKQNKIIGFLGLDENHKVLRSVIDHQLIEEDRIDKLFHQNSSIIYTFPSKKSLSIYKYLNGTIDRIEDNFQNLVGVTFFQEDHLFVATEQGIKVYKGLERSGAITEKINNFIRQKNMKFVSFLKKITILEETFLVIGFKVGGLLFLNKNMDCKEIVFNDQISVTDGCPILHQHHPFLIISTTNQDRISELYSIDLISFNITCVLRYKDSNSPQNRTITKVTSCFNKVFVGISHLGVLVFKVPNFKERLGVIIGTGNLRQIEVEEDGNLLIFQEGDRHGSLSIFKVRND